MLASKFFISTLKEAPADAEIISHQLMLRAGLIKRMAAGIYTYMPMGLRIIRKIETIVRNEMNAAGAIELSMPVVQPAELWQQTGRWEKYGAELMRVKDRHGRDFIIQPTSEEVVTSVVASEVKSYRQLPVNLYHIQTKFRDERRPRFGVMRGREFTMKDAYSFDRNVEGLKVSYQKMFDAYITIFTRFGLQFRAVQADNGAIGGEGSHEFHVIAKTGEDALVYCPTSSFAANIESAQALPLLSERVSAKEALTLTLTPQQSKCESVAEFLKLPLTQTVKSLVLAVDQGEGKPAQICLLLIRGDHELNEIKVGKISGMTDFRFATESEILTHFGTPPGYLGPIGLTGVRVIADTTVARMSDFVCGANQVDHHFTGVNWGRDLPEPEVADIRNVVAGDPSPCGGGALALERGIEVGHVFQLGTRYSIDLNANYLDENGKPQPMQMGCYGIGITRIMGAAIEQNFDDEGIIWPASIAPFSAVICLIGADKSVAVQEQAQLLYQQLVDAGIDVIVDDRGLRPGVMFADWELIGIPVRVVIGERGLAEGLVEVRTRRAGAVEKIAPTEVLAWTQKALA